MNITLYRNNSDNSVINKTLVNALEFADVYLLDETSITNPAFILIADYTQISAFNYLYCEDMGNRYYYITDIKSLDGERISIACKTDVLMSFRDDINKCIVNVDRSTINSLPLIADSALSTAARATVILKKFSGCEFSSAVTADMNSIVVTTIGG